MPTPLQFRVFSSTALVGGCVYAEDAAALVALQGEGGRVAWNGSVVWREGHEEQSAAESYDFAATVMYDRIRARQARMGSNETVYVQAWVDSGPRQVSDPDYSRDHVQ